MRGPLLSGMSDKYNTDLARSLEPKERINIDGTPPENQ